ncbi:olfactory receptor 6N2-like [Hyla sarda]|uniref:olfactory receptor 6N2-like n=1 Tax=Hyla sarda TaxID=327740 RepID=UPI0024C434E3|nr:olfactory receptor 6N2-like [Hyla sarda]
MEIFNQTKWNYFVLEGFVELENYSSAMFIVFLTIYILTLIGNMLIILVVYKDINLHKPMYFFIVNLSFLETWYVTTTTPKLLMMLLTKDKKISFYWCFAQLYMFHGLGITEGIVLSVMAVDRFVAICKPLRYNIIMSTRVYRNLSLMCWINGFSIAIIPVTLTSLVPLCGSYHLYHFFCDLAPLLSLACGDITVTVTINRFVGGFTTMFNLAIIILVYINITYSIIKMKTKSGRIKAFSTCSSHLTVVTLFFGTACIVYAVPKKTHSVDTDKLYALVYAMFTPFLNPIIYSLRNREFNTPRESMRIAKDKPPLFICELDI